MRAMPMLAPRQSGRPALDWAARLFEQLPVGRDPVGATTGRGHRLRAVVLEVFPLDDEEDAHAVAPLGAHEPVQRGDVGAADAGPGLAEIVLLPDPLVGDEAALLDRLHIDERLVDVSCHGAGERAVEAGGLEVIDASDLRRVQASGGQAASSVSGAGRPVSQRLVHHLILCFLKYASTVSRTLVCKVSAASS